MKNGKVLTLVVNNTKSNEADSVLDTILIHGYLMSWNDQQLTWRNQRLTVEHYLQDFLLWGDSREKYNIYGDIKVILERNCKVGKIMKLLMEAQMFEKIK